MEQINTRILDNRKITGNYYKLSFAATGSFKTAQPGHFLEIKVTGGREPFLRKPLGIHRIYRKDEKAICEVLYEVIGEGTKRLSQRKSGEQIDIIGPLGNGFKLQDPGSRLHILVAGGIGAAPLVYLAQKLVKVSRQKAGPAYGGKSVVLLGAKTKKHILCENEFKNLGCNVKITTDDGSKGHKGVVTGILEQVLLGRGIPCGRLGNLRTLKQGGHEARPYVIYACGPKPMLKEVARIASENNIPCQVLLEEYMACGVGVCLGCAVATKDGYKMVCEDGTVFKADEIV